MFPSKTLVHGLAWSAIEKFLLIAVQIVVEIVMARFIAPKEYGIMGLLLIVISMSQVLVDSGLGNALIYKKDRDEKDFSTAFIGSVFIGFLLYCLVFVFAKAISVFFGSDITLLLRVAALAILFNSISVILKVRLSIKIDFKSQAKYSLYAVLISGIIGISMAYFGYEIWALVVQTLSLSFCSALLLFVNLGWFPKEAFSVARFKEMFGYSSKLLYAGLLNSVYMNANAFALGKFFPARELGLYTKSYQFTILPGSVLTYVVQRVFFPYYTSLQDDFRKLFKVTVSAVNISCILALPIVTLGVIYAPDIISLLLTEQWLPMTLPFQLLLAAVLFYPMIAMNMNVFQITGKTGLFFWVELISKTVSIIILILLFQKGITGICLGIFISFGLQYLITSVAVSKSLKQNFAEFLPTLLFLAYGTAIGFVAFKIYEINSTSILRFVLPVVVIIFSYGILIALNYKKLIVSFMKNKNLK